MKITLLSQVSIDGKITLSVGESSKKMLSILTESDMRFIHTYRNLYDGIIVGMNTVRTDNPSLTCRYGFENNPVRIIISRTMKMSENLNVMSDNNKTIFVTIENGNFGLDMLNKDEKFLIKCGYDNVDLKKMISILEDRFGIHSLIIEGGSELNWYFFK